MEGNSSRGEMEGEEMEVEVGGREEGKEEAEAEERKGEEGEEKGRGGRGLRGLLMRRKRMKLLPRSREVGEGLVTRVILDVSCVCPTL